MRPETAERSRLSIDTHLLGRTLSAYEEACHVMGQEVATIAGTNSRSHSDQHQRWRHAISAQELRIERTSITSVIIRSASMKSASSMM